MRLHAFRFGLAAGILWAITMFVMTLANLWFGYGGAWLHMMANVYPGYSISAGGAFIGLIYGFFDGLIGVSIFAWIYNKLL